MCLKKFTGTFVVVQVFEIAVRPMDSRGQQLAMLAGGLESEEAGGQLLPRHTGAQIKQ